MYILVKSTNCVEAARSLVCVGRQFTEECRHIEELGVFKTVTFDQCGKPVWPVRVYGEIVNIILMDVQLLGKIM